MDNQNEVVKKLEENRKAAHAENHPQKRVSYAQVKFSKLAWTIGALLIDAVTAYAVWQITFWWWGAFWLVAGAGGLIYSDWLRDRVGNNFDQRAIGETGVITSAVAVVLMALMSGVVYMLGYTKVAWVEIVTFLAVIGLFFYHVIQSYRYYIIDDKYIEENKDARELERHEREMRRIARALREVEAAKAETEQSNQHEREHGEAWRIAYAKTDEQVTLKDKSDSPS